MNQDRKNSLLEVSELEVSYKKLKVLFGVSVDVKKGENVVLVGRNGAGKTTLFRTIAGFINKGKGSIFFKGKAIDGFEAHEVAQLGLKYIPQDKQVFSDLNVRENLELGSYATKDYDWDSVLVYFPKLKTLLDRKAGNLSGGERQMLLITMAMLGHPELLLMDEPTEGLAPQLVDELKDAFKEISKRTTLFIIEQNLPLTSEVADRVYSMKEGKVVAETKDSAEIKEMVFEKYL